MRVNKVVSKQNENLLTEISLGSNNSDLTGTFKSLQSKPEFVAVALQYRIRAAE